MQRPTTHPKPLAAIRQRTRSALERYGWRPIPIKPDEYLNGRRFVDTGQGRAVVEDIGSGAPILALPGFAGSADSWRALVVALGPGWRWLLVDPPGFGLADKVPGADYRAPAQAQRLLAVMDALRIERATLITSSGSAQIALAAAQAAPARCRALVLVAPFLVPSRSTKALLALGRLPLLAALASRLLATRWTVMIANRLGTEDNTLVTDSVVDQQFLAFGSPGFVRAYFEVLAHLAPEGLERILPQVKVPTLAVLGDNDLASDPVATRRLLSRLPDRRLIELTDCGHVIQRDRSERLAAILRQFLSSQFKISGP